jgi:hypothetical protein
MPQATDTLEAQADIHNLMSELKRANGGATRHTRTTNTAVQRADRQIRQAGRQKAAISPPGGAVLCAV